jgi:hypothetical protein
VRDGGAANARPDFLSLRRRPPELIFRRAGLAVRGGSRDSAGGATAPRAATEEPSNVGTVSLSPCFSPNNRRKTLLRPGVVCKIAAKNLKNQRITELGHGAAKAANRGAKRPEQERQKR